MAPSLDEQGVEEEEACTRTSQTHSSHVSVHTLWLHYTWGRVQSSHSYLWAWARCYTRLRSDSSVPRFSHLPMPEVPVGCWSTSSEKSQTNYHRCNDGPESLVSAVKLPITGRCQFTWKKLSSLSLRIPSLSKSDTLKIRVRAFTQRDFIWQRETKGQSSHGANGAARGDDNSAADGEFILLQLSSLDSTEGLWGAELLSERSKTAQRCSSGFWLNTVNRNKRQSTQHRHCRWAEP